MYEKKIEIIDSYIAKCDEILKSQDDKAAHILEQEFVGVYRDEISHITQGLLAFSVGEHGDNTYISDVSIVKQKLENYRADWLSKAEDKAYNLKIAEANAMSINNSNNNDNSNNLNNNVSITLPQVYDAVKSDKELSTEDQEKLKDLLTQVEGAKADKDKGKIWSTVKQVLSFIADKGADALIAADLI